MDRRHASPSSSTCVVAMVPRGGPGAGGGGGGVRAGVPGALQGGAQQGRGGTTNEIRLYSSISRCEVSRGFVHFVHYCNARRDTKETNNSHSRCCVCPLKFEVSGESISFLLFASPDQSPSQQFISGRRFLHPPSAKDILKIRRAEFLR